MDGARFANAGRARSALHPADITWRAGVDVLCFGGTKNGLPVGEAVVFFDREPARGLRLPRASRPASSPPRCASSPRPGSACWRTTPGCATPRHANAMAQRLHEQLQQASPACSCCTRPRPTRCSRGCRAPPSSALHAAGWRFYNFIGGGGCRFMCSWDTTAAGVDAFAAAVRDAAAAAAR